MSSLLSGSTAGLSIKELNTYKNASIKDYATKMGYNGLRDMAEELQYSDVTAYQASREMQASYVEDQLSDDEKKKYLGEDGNFDFNKFLQANPQWADTTTISAEYQLKFDLEKTKEAMQKTYDEAVGVIEAKVPNSMEKIENATIEVVTNLSKQVAQMGAEDA
jgi:hypothetical protein